MKVLGLLVCLAMSACRAGYEPEGCAFDEAAKYSYRALPDGREQGPGTLRDILGAEPETLADCHGERFIVHMDNGIDATYTVKDINADGSMIVRLGLTGVDDKDFEDILLWEK